MVDTYINACIWQRALTWCHATTRLRESALQRQYVSVQHIQPPDVPPRLAEKDWSRAVSQQCLCQKGCHLCNVQKASHRLRGAPLRLSPALYLATIFPDRTGCRALHVKSRCPRGACHNAPSRRTAHENRLTEFISLVRNALHLTGNKFLFYLHTCTKKSISSCTT